MTVDKDRLYKKLDHVGEHVVRRNLSNGVYGDDRRPLVEEWLEQFEESEEAAAESEAAEEGFPEAAVDSDPLDPVRQAEKVSVSPYSSSAGSNRGSAGKMVYVVLAVVVIGGLIYLLA